MVHKQALVPTGPRLAVRDLETAVSPW